MFKLTFFSIIGTHDIQNVTVDSLQPGEIRVRGDFIDLATATGSLLIVYSLNNNSDVHYLAFDKGSERDFDVNLTSVLTGTEYGVSVFTLENGLPFPRVVSLPQVISVIINGTQGLSIHCITFLIWLKSHK